MKFGIMYEIQIPEPHYPGVEKECHGQQQSLGVHPNMSLAALHFLAGVITPRPPFSVVFTDWLSITAPLGVDSRPAA